MSTLYGFPIYSPDYTTNCGPPPADPNAPGFHPGNVDAGPNHFQLGLNGPDPDLAVGGTHDQQEFQRDKLLQFVPLAGSSYATRFIPGAPRIPSDTSVANTLAGLDRNPPIGTDGVDVTHAVYQSNIPNATVDQAYNHFVNNAGQVFAAGGMEIRPPTTQLVDGGRYMLEIGGPAPTWLPIEIKLDPARHAITIHTLDGHPLRGEQTFTFTSDCNGGVVLTQDARFQASSNLAGELQQIASISAGQHLAWQHAHREIYGEFNGDPNYEGLGTGLFSEQQTSAWLGAARNVILYPGRSTDAAIDAGGEVVNAGYDFSGRAANWGIDETGERVDDAMDFVGIGGGDQVELVFDVAGNVVSDTADRAGDVASTVIDKGGDLIGRGVDLVFG